MKKNSPLISAEELLQIKNNQDVVLIDASFGPNALELYENEHLDNAVYVDLNNDLAEIPEDFSKGGRHPLPSLEKFSKTLQKLGIQPSSHVIVYDRAGGQLAAARFWWMLRAINHEKVQVLDGGFEAAKKAGIPINNKKVKIPSTPLYPVSSWKLPSVDMGNVEKATLDDDYLIIDVRSAERFDGETEPIDAVAGHIPNAVNVPLSENLTTEKLFLSAKKLHKKYSEIFEGRDFDKIIVHCGSGVTACHTLLATEIAGLEMPNLYVGSWSEYSRNEHPLITKK